MTVSKNMPKKTTQATTGKKMKTGDLYMKDGVPCGDMEATGPINFSGGPKVGGTDMGVHNSYDNGIPNAGREDISAEVMSPAHKANVTDSVLNTKEDKTWGGIIAPLDMGVHNTFGVK